MTLDDPLDLLGETIQGRYRIEGLVSSGQLATIYRARSTLTGDPYELKVLHSFVALDAKTIDGALRALKLESEQLLALGTAAVVPLTEVGIVVTSETSRIPFVVTPAFSGGTLQQVIDDEARAGSLQPWTLARALTVIAPVAELLARAHGRGLAHL